MGRARVVRVAWSSLLHEMFGGHKELEGGEA
jgi:hypothetical protein